MKTPQLIYVRHNKSASAFPMTEKVITFVELTIVLKGTLQYRINHQTFTLNSGDAVLVPRSALRERKESKEVTDYISFNFQTEEPIDLPPFIPGILSTDVRLLILTCDEIQKLHIYSYKEPISHLLGSLITTIKNTLKNQHTHPLVTKIIRYLHVNISKKIALSDIAQHTFFSAIYCDSVFKKEVGKSIIEYLLEARISLAKQLLTEGTLPMRKISEAVGFRDYNYFCRTFKKRTGYTPGQYRK